jgi:hypothetical protein
MKILIICSIEGSVQLLRNEGRRRSDVEGEVHNLRRNRKLAANGK